MTHRPSAGVIILQYLFLAGPWCPARIFPASMLFFLVGLRGDRAILMVTVCVGFDLERTLSRGGQTCSW
ncbi:hypothetical protein CSUI_001691 [Cystoisospora suis]|uniref:Transmembrane protein n=1 Tax=Cystoisospora suis TaxID=483139 RepID=A0A2C6LBJ5_9APIC|nr:hypothetical protein CSUI_001691 [Cystoisospora suis]